MQIESSSVGIGIGVGLGVGDRVGLGVGDGVGRACNGYRVGSGDSTVVLFWGLDVLGCSCLYMFRMSYSCFFNVVVTLFADEAEIKEPFPSPPPAP